MLADRIADCSGALPLLSILASTLQGFSVPMGVPDALREFAHVRDAAEALLFSQRGTASLAADKLQALAALARQASDQFGEPFAAAALFSACDTGLGKGLWSEFSMMDRLEIKPGMPFPLARPDLKRLFRIEVKGKKAEVKGKRARSKRKLTAAPWALESPYTRREFIDVLPALGYRVVFDFQRPGLLNDFSDRPVLAIGLPNRPGSDRKEIVIDHADYTNRLFFGVRPANATEQWARLEQILQAADARQAFALVLPELCMIPELATKVGVWLRAARHLQIVAAGSYHCRDGASEKSNRMELHTAMGSLPPGLHDKLAPFEAELNGQRLVEDISPKNTITVHWSRGWSLVTLICKDLLDKSVMTVLERLRPSLVFVAAYSERVENFGSEVAHLASKCQSIVVVSNFSEDIAVFAGISAVPLSERNRVTQRDVSRALLPLGLGYIHL